MRLVAFLIVIFSACTAWGGDFNEEDSFARGMLLKVANIAADEVLNLRAQPSAGSDIVASLSAHAFSLASTGEKKAVGRANWVKVEYEGVTGWANARNLARQNDVVLSRQELFDAGISLKRKNAPHKITESPQHPNQCPFGDYVAISVSDRLLRHFEGRGFSLETLCLAIDAPMSIDLETGYQLPNAVIDEPEWTASVLLNVPDCMKAGTPLIDCRVHYHWNWGRDLIGEEGEVSKLGNEIDKVVRRGIASGQIQEGLLEGEKLDKLWEENTVLADFVRTMYISFCDVSPRYPRGYACALSSRGTLGEEAAAAKGSVSLWGDEKAVACVNDGTCTPTSIFFGTVRRLGQSALRVTFDKDRAEKLSLGRALVTVPKSGRTRGEVARPAWSDILALRSPFAEDPTRHFTIPPGGVILYPDEGSFVRAVSQFVKDSANFKDHAIVFVHGFNVSFEAALYRTAQLTYDLGEAGRPFGTAFLFSWPSAGELDSYLYDIDSARNEWAVDGLVRFLRLVADRSGAKQVHVIGHSMGNVPTLLALDKLAKSDHRGQFSQIVFASPDVDKTDFEIISQRILKTARGFTLYASSNDVAMVASRRFRLDTPRAGDVSETGPVIVGGIDSIDATDASLDYFSLRHSEYADNKELLDDLGRLFKNGVRPPDLRSRNFVVESYRGATYWKWRK